MIVAACSGFPVPVSRYWREFPAVEVAETEIGIPGQGTVRRWLRESPEGFVFSLLAPQAISAQGFKRSEEAQQLLAQLGKLAQTLRARAVVFVGADDFKPNRNTKAAVKAFIADLPETLPRPVLDLPAWRPEDVRALGTQRPYSVAFDPTRDRDVGDEALHYVRLPGPAGRRSRYDEGALDQVAEHCNSAKTELVICVFRNVDMHANATTMRKKLKS